MSHIRATIDGENYGQPSPPCSVIRIVLSGEALESYVGKRLELELVQEGYTVSQLNGGSELAAKGAVLYTERPPRDDLHKGRTGTPFPQPWKS